MAQRLIEQRKRIPLYVPFLDPARDPYSLEPKPRPTSLRPEEVNLVKPIFLTKGFCEILGLTICFWPGSSGSRVDTLAVVWETGTSKSVPEYHHLLPHCLLLLLHPLRGRRDLQPSWSLVPF